MQLWSFEKIPNVKEILVHLWNKLGIIVVYACIFQISTQMEV